MKSLNTGIQTLIYFAFVKNRLFQLSAESFYMVWHHNPGVI